MNKPYAEREVTRLSDVEIILDHLGRVIITPDVWSDIDAIQSQLQCSKYKKVFVSVEITNFEIVLTPVKPVKPVKEE